jgi:hypothetical protein
VICYCDLLTWNVGDPDIIFSSGLRFQLRSTSSRTGGCWAGYARRAVYQFRA